MRQLSPDDPSSELERLYEYYQQPIVRYLANLVHDQELARDLCQETFEHVLNHLSRQETTLPQTAYHLKNWLYRIAKNRAIDHHRHNKLIDFLPLPESEAELNVEGDEDRILERLWLQEEVALMPPKYRECFLSKHYYGYTQKEIAAKLGITESAVSANISHGKAHLSRKYFSGTDGLKPSVASYIEQEIEHMLQGFFKGKGLEHWKKFGEIRLGNQWYTKAQIRLVNEEMTCKSVATNKLVTIRQAKILFLPPDLKLS